jgi:hypothetical protein
MERQPSGIKPESWLVSAGRDSEPGAPLNVPLMRKPYPRGFVALMENIKGSSTF